MHKSEDAELEQMKEEFTKRIGESEVQLQAAAKVCIYSLFRINFHPYFFTDYLFISGEGFAQETT